MTPSDIDQIARTAVGAVADASVRALSLACVIGVAIVMFRKRRAAVRLSAWTVVLYAALAMPVIGLVVPAWQWRVPTITVLQGWWQAPATPPVAAASQFSTAAAQPTAGVSAAPVAPAWSASAIAAAIYLAGVLVFVIHAGLGWLATRRLRLSGRTIADAGTLATLSRHASAAGMGTPPRLVESAQLFVPVTMVVVRPVIMLPSDWRDWPAGKLDAVLVHEVAHVARRDALTQRLALGYRAVLWCNPFSWWLRRRLSDLAEQASDEAALEAGVDPATYAGALLDFFARLQHGPRRAEWHVAMARRADADAAQRVERILSWKGGPIMTRSKLLVAGIVLAAVPAVAVAASVRFTPEIPASVIVPATPVASPTTVSQTPVAPARPVTARPKAGTTAARPQTPPTPPAAPKPPAPATPPTPAGLQTPDDDFAKDAYPANTPGLLQPKALTLAKPRYTPDAMRQKLQGTVTVEIIVLADGTVGKARIKESLDKQFGLDEAALDAAWRWTFTPGALNGQTVPVHTTLVLEFRLH